CARGPPHTIW
nr:immunoglobulin heavy chain junction region [Macaca mulatta]MOW93028.1 immunoglobulin heavy chain junction region [Macaca mulatta]